MIDTIQSMFAFDFMRNAFLASLLVGVVCGLIGTLVVLNRIVFLPGGDCDAGRRAGGSFSTPVAGRQRPGTRPCDG